MFALFKDGEQVSKAHSTKFAAVIEAIEKGLATRSDHDFPDTAPSVHTVALAEGVEIREIGGEKQ